MIRKIISQVKEILQANWSQRHVFQFLVLNRILKRNWPNKLMRWKGKFVKIYRNMIQNVRICCATGLAVVKKHWAAFQVENGYWPLITLRRATTQVVFWMWDSVFFLVLSNFYGISLLKYFFIYNFFRKNYSNGAIQKQRNRLHWNQTMLKSQMQHIVGEKRFNHQHRIVEFSRTSAQFC